MKEKLTTQQFKQLLQFSILGMATELRERQENILLGERFSTYAVYFPATFNPTGSYKKEKLPTQYARYMELMQFAEVVQALYDEIKDQPAGNDWTAFLAQYFTNSSSQ